MNRSERTSAPEFEQVIDFDRGRFRELTARLSRLGDSVGTPIRGYEDPGLPHFSRLPEGERTRTLALLETFIGVCESVVSEPQVSLADSTTLMWAAMKDFGLRPPSDLFDHLRGDQVVELYRPDGIQFFRNFQFYRYCSYTIEEVSSIPWFELYERSPEITERLMRLSQDLFSMTESRVVPIGVGPHRQLERRSRLRFEVQVENETAAPLFDGEGRVAAIIVMSRGEFINLPVSLHGDWG